MSCLEIQPEFRARPESSSQEKGRLGSDASLTPNDLVHSLERNAQLARKIYL